MKKQEFTSRNTSVNSRNLPSAFRKFGITSGEVVLDYGCGRFWGHAQDFCYNQGAVLYLPFDKYNLRSSLNDASLEYAFRYGVDKIFCCNVLNVIKEDEIVQYIVDECLDNLRAGGTAIFQVYIGNRSGVGAPSKDDCYQRNAYAHQYEQFFKKYVDSKYSWHIKYTSCYIVVCRPMPF